MIYFVPWAKYCEIWKCGGFVSRRHKIFMFLTKFLKFHDFLIRGLGGWVILICGTPCFQFEDSRQDQVRRCLFVMWLRFVFLIIHSNLANARNLTTNHSFYSNGNDRLPAIANLSSPTLANRGDSTFEWKLID